MDKLEEHIRKNREELDKYNPSSGVWKKISRDIRTKKTIMKHWYSIAAMFIIILGISFFLLRSGSFTTYNRRINAIDKDLQLKETEIYYNNLINSLYTEATPLLTANPELKQELSYDISHIDSLCLEIKEDLKDNIANKEVVEALIQNYRIKIRLLEDILMILKETENNPEKEKNYEL